MRVIAAAGLTTMLHTALETQEYYGDVFFHTHNVKGVADTVNDELYALFGVIVYLLIFTRSMYLRRRRAPRQHSRSSA
jgi:hypothetical protein